MDYLDDKIEVVLKRFISYVFLFGGFVFVIIMALLLNINVKPQPGDWFANQILGLTLTAAAYTFYIITNHYQAANNIPIKLIKATEIVLALSLISIFIIGSL